MEKEREKRERKKTNPKAKMCNKREERYFGVDWIYGEGKDRSVRRGVLLSTNICSEGPKLHGYPWGWTTSSYFLKLKR